jgi:hypothetical protein
VIAVPAEANGALAIGWATVELDRAAMELGHLLAPGTTFEEAPSSAILGGRCRIGSAAGTPGVRIVLLEPDTEGRLAAALARAGEGWKATWVQDPGIDPGPRQVSRARPGPLGRERLLLGGPLAGPYRLFVEAVPSPP